MCEFKSAYVLRDKSLKGGFRLCLSPWTESHEELATIFNINQTSLRDQGARVEFKPSELAKAHILSEYKLCIDEERTPDWLTTEMKEEVSDKMRAYIKSIIVDGNVKLLIGGQFIIAPNAKIESANAIVINAFCGGTINAFYGGTINKVWGGTINEVWGGTINEVCGGLIKEVSKYFNGLLGKIVAPGRVVTDNRPAI